MSLFWLAVFLLTWTCSQSFALRNITVGDQDPLIHYYPTPSNWTPIYEDADAGGSHMLTSHKTAYARITYTCVSIYVISPLWPYRVTAALQLDDEPPAILDLQDHSVPPPSGAQASAPSRVVHSFIGTKSAEHTLTISVPSGDEFTIVNMFIFEVSDSTPTSAPISLTATRTLTVSTPVTSTIVVTTETSQRQPPTGAEGAPTPIEISTTTVRPNSSQLPTNQNLKTNPKKINLPKTIGMGVGIGLPFLLLLVVALCLYTRRTQRFRSERAKFVLIDPNGLDIGKDPAPTTSTCNTDGSADLRFEAVPMLELGAYPLTQLRVTSQYSPQQGDKSARKKSNTQFDLAAASDVKGQPIPPTPPPVYVSTRGHTGQSTSSWEFGHPQPLKFIPII